MSFQDKTPPMAPPRLRGGTEASTPSQPVRARFSATQLKRLSTARGEGPLGLEEKNEEDFRTLLLNRLNAFYRVYEGERVAQGVGHIVDWTLTNGEGALNKRLELKYGEDLLNFERRTQLEAEAEAAAERQSGKRSTFKPAESFMLTPGNRQSSGSVESNLSNGPTIRDRLVNFYIRYDPERLRKGIDDLVEYVQRKGLPALNQKLLKKYGVTLEDFEAGKAPQSPALSVASSASSPNAGLMDGRGRGGSQAAASGKNNSYAGGRLSMSKFLRRSFRAAQKEKPGFLPPHVRPLLELFYSKYDQTKISTGGVNAIATWAAKHGIAALNAQLKAKYLEDLDEFAERIFRLREDLANFYRVHDTKKLDNGGVDKILRWAIRNGRAAVNKQLRTKYGCDLEQQDPAKIQDEEPDF